MFSIPPTLYSYYALPSAGHFTLPPAGPTKTSLNVGIAVKDMPIGAETEMKKTHALSVIKIKDQFAADEIQYKSDFQIASDKAAEASKVIGNARNKKIIAITLLVTSIIAVVGFAVAAAVTGTWPLAFIAVPFLITLAPTSYYTDLFRKLVNKLNNAINAPELLVKPVLRTPQYNPKIDLDLQQSRIDAQNSVATASLKQLATSQWTNDEITGYSLLDRVALMDSKKRPEFYAKCIQLIDGYAQIVKEHTKLTTGVESEFRKLDRELKAWKSDQDSHIASQERALRDQEHTQILREQAQREGRPFPNTGSVVVGSIVTTLSRWDLERLKTETAKNYGRRDSENHNWKKSTLTNIETAFKQAQNYLEQQYGYAKLTAA